MRPTNRKKKLTPLIRSPKLSGNLGHLGVKSVGMGSHKLPGLWRLITPSVRRTKRRTKDETIPTRDVRERNRRGRKVVGRMTKKLTILKKSLDREGNRDDMLSLKRTTSAMLTALSSMQTAKYREG